MSLDFNVALGQSRATYTNVDRVFRLNNGNAREAVVSTLSIIGVV
jgi:hypothetical protein